MPNINVNNRTTELLQEYLRHKNFPRMLSRLWQRNYEQGRLSANLAWTQSDVVRLDSDIFWIMATVNRMDNPQIQYEASVMEVLRNFAGIRGLDADGNNIVMQYDEAQNARKRLVSRYFDFLADTKIETLNPANAEDLEKMFLLTQAYQHLDTLQRRYGDVYQDWLRNNPAREDLLALRRQQAKTLGEQRGGKRDLKLDKEDLIFINGKSLREYTLEHLPADSRTDTNVKNYSGALLARAMQEGTNRISFAQVSSMADGLKERLNEEIRTGLREKLASATAAQNQRRQNEALPLVKLNDSLGIEQNLQEQSMDALRDEWHRRDEERIRQQRAEQNRTQPAPAQNRTQPAPAQNGTQPAPAQNGTQPAPAQNRTQPTRVATNFGAILGSQNENGGNRPRTEGHPRQNGQAPRQASQMNI